MYCVFGKNMNEKKSLLLQQKKKMILRHNLHSFTKFEHFDYADIPSQSECLKSLSGFIFEYVVVLHFYTFKIN